MKTKTPDPGPPHVEPVKSSRWPSLVWLVPALAIIAAIALLFQNFATRGPLIKIEFATASGLKAGETVIKYRDVEVGRIEAIRFTDDLTKVIAEARMDQSIAPYLGASAKFWVVRPQVSAQGITGLDTVLSGSYIEATWDTEAGATQSSFVGLEAAPLTPDGAPGIRVTLRGEDGGSLEIGSPIFFKRVEVGRVESKALSEDGRAVEFTAFINAPNDQRINTATRFWNASGVDLQLGADGAQLRIASLSSLIRGGASFESGVDGDPIGPDYVFPLFASESDARDVLDSEIGTGEQVAFRILFGGSVRGLRPGASVEYRGIRVGRVEAVSASVDPMTNRFRTRTRIHVSPSLLGLGIGGEDAVMDFMRAAVANGLRAKLALGNLLTGALYVELDDVVATHSTAIDESGTVPVLPAVASDLDELAGSVEGVLDRVNALPVEALMGNAVVLLENINKIVADDSTQAVPAKTLALLTAAEALIAAPELKQVAVDAEGLIASLRAIAEDPALIAAPGRLDQLLTSLGVVVTTLEEAGAAEDLAASVAALRGVMEAPEFAQLPASLNTTLGAATALLTNPGLADLPGEAVRTLASVRAVLDQPALQSMPAEMTAALVSLRTRLDDPGLTQALSELGPLVASARQAVDGLNPSLAALQAVLTDPGLQAAPEELRGTLAAARSLLEDEGLQQASAEAAATLSVVRKLLESPAAQAAPEELAATLTAARGIMNALVESEAAENLSQTLAATRQLAEDPALIRAADAFSGAFIAIQEILAAPGVDALPAATADALTEAAALIAQFRKENLGAATVAALSGVNGASQAVQRAANSVPALLGRLGELSARADTLLQSLSVGSELNYEALAAIRDIRDAARAVAELAELAEQKPTSFILGK